MRGVIFLFYFFQFWLHCLSQSRCQTDSNEKYPHVFKSTIEYVRNRSKISNLTVPSLWRQRDVTSARKEEGELGWEHGGTWGREREVRENSMTMCEWPI